MKYVCVERTAKSPVQVKAAAGKNAIADFPCKPPPIGQPLRQPGEQEAQVFRLG